MHRLAGTKIEIVHTRPWERTALLAIRNLQKQGAQCVRRKVPEDTRIIGFRSNIYFFSKLNGIQATAELIRNLLPDNLKLTVQESRNTHIVFQYAVWLVEPVKRVSDGSMDATKVCLMTSPLINTQAACVGVESDRITGDSNPGNKESALPHSVKSDSSVDRANSVRPDLVTCPICNSPVCADRLERHQRINHFQTGSSRLIVGPNRHCKAGRRKGEFALWPASRKGHCRQCGRPSMPGSDYCYGCDPG